MIAGASVRGSIGRTSTAAFPSLPLAFAPDRQRSWLLSAFIAGLLYVCLACAGGGCAASQSQMRAPIGSLSQIGERLAQCWQAPQIEPPQIIEVTVRLSFSRTGAVIGQPRVVYIRAPAQAGLREKIAMSVLAAIKACTPLPFAPAFGASVAGRIFAIRLNSLPLTGRQRLI